MSKHRHKRFAGGATGDKASSGSREHEIVSGNKDVFDEAEDKAGTRKRGGKVKRAAGGKIVGLMTGGVAKPRMDRPGRKRGGAVGADKSPLSSAHKASDDGNSTPGSADTYGGTPAPKKPAQDAHTRGRP